MLCMVVALAYLVGRCVVLQKSQDKQLAEVKKQIAKLEQDVEDLDEGPNGRDW